MTIHSYRCLCDPEDILLIYPDINITLPENLLFSEIYTYISNELTYWPKYVLVLALILFKLSVCGGYDMLMSFVHVCLVH